LQKHRLRTALPASIPERTGQTPRVGTSPAADFPANYGGTALPASRTGFKFAILKHYPF